MVWLLKGHSRLTYEYHDPPINLTRREREFYTQIGIEFDSEDRKKFLKKWFEYEKYYPLYPTKGVQFVKFENINKMFVY